MHRAYGEVCIGNGRAAVLARETSPVAHKRGVSWTS